MKKWESQGEWSLQKEITNAFQCTAKKKKKKKIFGSLAMIHVYANNFCIVEYIVSCSRLWNCG